MIKPAVQINFKFYKAILTSDFLIISESIFTKKQIFYFKYLNLLYILKVLKQFINVFKIIKVKRGRLILDVSTNFSLNIVQTFLDTYNISFFSPGYRFNPHILVFFIRFGYEKEDFVFSFDNAILQNIFLFFTISFEAYAQIITYHIQNELFDIKKVLFLLILMSKFL